MKQLTFVLLVFLLFTSFKEKELTWVAIGDSITYLNDHLDETGNRVAKGYLTRVVEKLPNLRYVNQGHNGWTSGAIADHINNLGLVAGDVYTIFLGTNDWWAGRPVGTIQDFVKGNDNNSLYASFRIIINEIRQLNPQARIVLITPMQRGDFVYIADANNNAHSSLLKKNGQSLEDFAKAIVAIGKHEGIQVIDLYHNSGLSINHMVKYKRLKDPENGQYKNYKYPLEKDIPFNPGKDEYPYPVAAIDITYDGLHPSDKGNAIIANEVGDVFKKGGLAPRWDKYLNLDAYSEAFWKADTIVDERVQILKDGDDAFGELLFAPRKIISVKSTDGSKNFIKGQDWKYKGRTLWLSPGSAIPVIEMENLVFKEKKDGLSMPGKKEGTFVLFNENAYFSSRQISVTYIPNKSRLWHGPVPKYDETRLPRTLKKLSSGEDVKIVFYGNSIEKGYNASGFENVPPYMPTWPELVTFSIRKHYSSRVEVMNSSVPGKLAKWGLDSVKTLVNKHKPDLVIIGFGMNDGSSGVQVHDFGQQIKGIMDAVSAENAAAEFIIVTPMLPNPDATQNGLQLQYRVELLKLLKPGIALADMTGVHEELLKFKSYQDMTGNNVNHPNDYLARWYAQMINGLLIKP